MNRLGELLDNKQRTLEEANELIDLLAGFLATQSQSIVNIREQMVAHKDEIELLGSMVVPKTRDRKTLIGFDPPKLKVN